MTKYESPPQSKAAVHLAVIQGFDPAIFGIVTKTMEPACQWAFVCESFQNRHFVAIDFGKGCKEYLNNDFAMVDRIVCLRNRKMKELVAEFRAAEGDGGDPAIPRELMTPRIITVDVQFGPAYVASVAVLSSWRRHGVLQI